MIQTIQFIFCLTGFVVFLIGFILLYALISAILLTLLGHWFQYNYRVNHPDIFRACIYQAENGEWKSTPRNWVCMFMPKFSHHWSHWVSG